MKRVSLLIMVTLFLTGIFMVPSAISPSISSSQITSDTSPLYETSTPSALPDREIRVALYNETNFTCPAYTQGSMNTNYSIIYSVLDNAGYSVDRITFQDILDYKLILADYDVIVLPDNNPRENISNHVKEFWLGGGGVLSFDSSIGYLGWAGILPRENESIDDGRYAFWNYVSTGPAEIQTLHPVTKSYDVTDQLTYTTLNYGTYLVDSLSTASIYSSVEILALSAADPNEAVIVASDPNDKGGKVVHIGIPIDPWSNDINNLVIDAVDWLAPRPKARIAFDFSHQPRLHVDSWDEFATTWSPTNNYGEYRNLLVNHSYTFDKFFPSSEGNFTTERLEQYDMIILSWPDLNYTTTEMSTINNWVADGGSMLVMGDRSGFLPSGGNERINELLADYDMEIGSYNVLDDQTAIRATPYHISAKTSGSIGISYRNYINLTGNDAKAVYKYGNNIVVAAQEYGEGRVLLFSDINIFDSLRLKTSGNKYYAVDAADWLTSTDAKILYYTNYPFTIIQKSPAALALNELGLNYFPVRNQDFYNRSLYWYEWDLVIFDSPWAAMGYTNDTSDYLDTGGKLIISYYWTVTHPDEPLWAKLGFAYADEKTVASTTYFWDAGHPIFNNPIDLGESYVSGGEDYGRTGEALTVFDNATAIAGYASSVTADEASIVLGLNGRSLYNGYLIDQYNGDTDESAYKDNFELWINQIVFMLRPSIDSPSDIEFQAGSDGPHEITWTPYSISPDSYTITINGSTETTDVWDGNSVTVDLTDWEAAGYEVTLTVTDAYGQEVSDTVLVKITASSLIGDLDINTLLIIAAVVLVVIIGVVVFSRKRKQ
ncbi:MAG: hypothetical protein GF411_12815 [Candidatus Lokiarchaeota archaeon]|nr:hypothetical protein [Candidatus Lokiarchaeota archaeon]